MEKLADFTNDQVAMETISVLEKVLSEKTGQKVVLVAYGGAKYADLNEDKEVVDKITDLEKDISAKTGKDVILVAFSV
ncbi:hypothetical protein [Alkalibacter mobilis]|uniref:hypothetical protein n=1 Tax=Alkalibacter mobilis TaxID=2787712 RepID=UPI00189FBD2D|nr:hypothetical protein [Alkalibacter mobilis]MBF7097493.1 hypothetical protein [Alkalibacter mobilis]